MPTLAIESIELQSTLRPMGRNGSPSSDDYNNSTKEVLSDLAAISETLNLQILPVLNALSIAAAPAQDGSTVGVQGRTVFSDTSDQSNLFYDSRNEAPLSVADSLRVIDTKVNGLQTRVDNIATSVAALRTALATTGQTDAQSALSGVYSTLDTLQQELASLQSAAGGASQSIGNRQTQTAQTDTIFPGALSTVDILWSSPFPNNNYAVSYSLQDDTGSLQILNFSYMANGAGITVRVQNKDSVNSATGYVIVTGQLFTS